MVCSFIGRKLPFLPCSFSPHSPPEKSISQREHWLSHKVLYFQLSSTSLKGLWNFWDATLQQELVEGCFFVSQNCCLTFPPLQRIYKLCSMLWNLAVQLMISAPQDLFKRNMTLWLSTGPPPIPQAKQMNASNELSLLWMWSVGSKVCVCMCVCQSCWDMRQVR